MVHLHGISHYCCFFFHSYGLIDIDLKCGVISSTSHVIIEELTKRIEKQQH